MIRRLIVGSVLALTLVPTVASAAATTSFSSKSMGIAFRYPASWRLTSTPSGAVKQVTAYSSGSKYSLTVSVYPIKPARTMPGTLHRYIQYSSTLEGPVAAHYHWKAASFAGRPAESTVTYPATEGGVQTAIGLYVVGSHAHIYAISIESRGRPLPKNVSSFSAVYRQIFRSWKFL